MITSLWLCVVGPPPAAALPQWAYGYGRMAVTEDLSSVCEGILNSLQCARAIEKYQQARPGARFRRSRDVVTITLEDGQSVSLRDEFSKNANGEATKRKSYSYIEFLPQMKQHLVHVQHYEGHCFWLVDARSGSKTEICGVPIRAPSGRRFACYYSSLEDPSSIEVWRITANGFQREMAFTPVGWVPTDLVWLGDDSIRIAKESYEGEPLGDALVNRTGSNWVCEEGNRKRGRDD